MKFLITALAAGFLFWGCLTNDDDNDSKGTPITSRTAKIIKIDETKKTMTVVSTEYDCDGTKLDSTHDTTISYYEITNNKLIVADTGECKYVVMTGTSKSIYGTWTSDQTNSTTAPSMTIPGCDKLEPYPNFVDGIGALLENYSATATITQDKITSNIYGNICYANLVISEPEMLFMDSAITFQKTNCNSVAFTTPQNKTGAVNVSSTTDSIKLSISLGTKKCETTFQNVLKFFTQETPNCSVNNYSPDTLAVLKYTTCLADMGVLDINTLLEKK